MEILTENRKTAGAIVRPKLPKKLTERSTGFAVLFIVYAIGIYFIPALLAYKVWNANVDTYIKIILMLPLFFVSQQGLHLYGWIGHEGFHLSLSKNKYVSAYVGVIISSMVFSFMQIGASISHWNHHRYTNQEKDPDVEIFTKFKNLFSRLLFGRITANRIYLKNALKMAAGKDLPYDYKMPFTKNEIKTFARVNLLTSLLFTLVYLSVLRINPTAGVIFIVIPHIFLTFYSGIRSYLEHAGTGHGLLSDTRSRTASFFTWFYFGNNYHLEHHLYPMVPCYRLPGVHNYLMNIGFFDKGEVHIEKQIFKAYSFATGKYTYPEGDMEVSRFNPLEANHLL